jgi:hypothetical protein
VLPKLTCPRPITSEEKIQLDFVIALLNMMNTKSTLPEFLASMPEEPREYIKANYEDNFEDILAMKLGGLPSDLQRWLYRDEPSALYLVGGNSIASVAHSIKKGYMTFERALELNYDEDKLLEELI